MKNKLNLIKVLLIALTALSAVSMKAQPLTADIKINGVSVSAYNVCEIDMITLEGTPSGGTGVYTNHYWTSKIGSIFSSNSQITDYYAYGLGTDTVIYTVTDNSGATASDMLIITINPVGIYIGITVNTNNICAGVTNIFTAYSNGGPNVTYKWSVNGVHVGANSTIYTSSSLVPYDVVHCEVMSNLSCVGGYEISEDIQMQANPVNVYITETPASCPTWDNGTATVYAYGGTGPYTYLWNTNPPQTTQTCTGLNPGTYTVCVADSFGCASCDSEYIQMQANSVNVYITETPASCPTCADGTATANVYGGTAPYTYLWNTNPTQTTQTCTGLNPGTYTVCVADSFGCSSCDSVVIPLIQCSAGFTVYPDSNMQHHYYVVNNATGVQPVLYIWGWGDGSPNDTAAYPSHTYSVAGFYPICLYIVDAVGCTETYCNFFYIQKGTNTIISVDVIPAVITGLTEQAKDNSISLYPNPASSALSVELGVVSKGGQWKLYNAFGTLIEEKFFAENKFSIDVSRLAKGLYFLKVENENGVAVRRFIKE